MKVELSCAGCGGNRFNYPLVLTEQTVITCGDCGREVGTVAELQQKVIQQLTPSKAREHT